MIYFIYFVYVMYFILIKILYIEKQYIDYIIIKVYSFRIGFIVLKHFQDREYLKMVSNSRNNCMRSLVLYVWFVKSPTDL